MRQKETGSKPWGLLGWVERGGRPEEGRGLGVGGRGKSLKGDCEGMVGGGGGEGVRIRSTVKPVRPTAALM